MSLKDAKVIPVLAVDDLERAIAFYRDKLGFKAERSPSDPTGAVVEVNAESSLLPVQERLQARREHRSAAFSVA